MKKIIVILLITTNLFTATLVVFQRATIRTLVVTAQASNRSTSSPHAIQAEHSLSTALDTERKPSESNSQSATQEEWARKENEAVAKSIGNSINNIVNQ